MYGILDQSGLPLPALLDAINHAEVGHLPRAQQLTATSDDGARGPYQFMPGNLHDMGYGMPRDIPLGDVLSYDTSRDLAGRYVTGFTSEHGFKTPLEQLVAYTAGPRFAANWVARGANISELGPRTQSYIKRAAQYLNENYQQQEQPMDQQNASLFGFDLGPEITRDLQTLLQNDPGNFLAQDMLGYGAATPESAAAIAASMQPANREVRSPDQFRNQYPSTAVPMPDPALGGSGGGILTSPAYAGTTDPNAPYYDQNGVLNIPITEGTPTGRRDNTPLAANTPPPPPEKRKGMPLNQAINDDLLIRMGLAGVGGSARGGLAAFGEMGSAFERYQTAQANALKAAGKGGKKKGAGNAAANLPYAKAALDAINTIEDYVNDQGSSWWPFNDVTGPVGATLAHVPGTPAHNVAMQIDTIEAAIGFDRLQAMRDASPTGGALGQVSEMELTLLKSSLGSLRQSQTQDEFMRNLRAVQRHYQGAVEAIEAQQQAYQQGQRAPAPASATGAAPAAPAQPGGTPNNSNNLSAADAIVGIN